MLELQRTDAPSPGSSSCGPGEKPRRGFAATAFHALALATLLASGVHAAEKKHAGEQKPNTSDVLPRYFSGGELRIVSSSHQDTAWMDTPEACRQFRIDHNILPALERMRTDLNYTFCMEGMLHLMEFLEAHPELEQEVIQRTKEGRFEWGATFNQPYESWFSGEELVRELYFGRRWLRKHFPGCDAKVAFNPDPPARSWQMQQILAKAGVPYMFISRYHEGLYRWGSPDGSSVLVYTPGQYGNHAPLLNGDPAEASGAIRAKLGQQETYYAERGIPPVYALINSRDFSKPVDFSPLLGHWNAQPAGGAGGPPKMQYSSIRGFFEAIDQPAAKFDVLLGERPDVWAYITGPTHRRIDSVRREGARLLPAAEMFTTFAALLQGGFREWPRSQFAAAWMDQIYVDHGIGGKNGHVTDEVFLRRVTQARDTGRELLDRALGTIAAQVKADPSKGIPVVIFNSLSWPRSDVVEVALPGELAVAEHLRVADPEGREVAAQLSTLGEPEEINVAAAALGAKATASSSFSFNYDAGKAIDGTWAVREREPELGAADQWKSAPGAGPHWLAIDFGQARTIHKVVLRHEGVIGAFRAETRFNTADFVLQGADSADGPWTDLVAPITGNAASLSVHEFAPRSVRHLRLRITRSAQAGNEEPARIFELQAFAKNPAKARRLVFVAGEVPPLGYKTYYLSARKSAAPAGSEALPTATTAGCENRHFRVSLVPGGIKSIFDRQQDRELLDTAKFLGGEVFTMLSVAEDNRSRGTDAGEFGTMPLPVMDDTFDRVARHQPAWRLEEHGPVRSVFELEQSLADVKVRQRAMVWHGVKRIDCEVDLIEFSGKFWREFRMALPLALEKPRLVYEVPMGVVEIGRDEIPTTGGLAYTNVGHGRTLEYTDQCRDIHPRQVQNFVAASDARGGLTMSSCVSVFDWIDPTTTEPTTKPLLQPVLLASRKSCNGQGVWYPQTGDHSYRFSITSHEGDWRNGWKTGIAANAPLHAVFARPDGAGSLPATMSFASVAAENVVISAIKKGEDDDSVVVRVYDIEGRDSRATLNFFQPVSVAHKTNIIEEGDESLRVERGRVTLDVGHHAIETFRLTSAAGYRSENRR